MPCGYDSYTAITSAAQLENVYSDVKARCGDSKASTEWRQRVDQEKVDFSRAAVIILYEVLGTGGKATLDLQGPKAGVLRAAIEWNVPKGPALPIATAACFSFSVDKSLVKRVETRKKGSTEVVVLETPK